MAIVYLLTNIENGKRYVGKTKFDVDKRWYNHVQEAKRGSPYAIHAAIRKYGRDAFTRKILGEYPTEEEALAAEQEWIVKLGTIGAGGYNITAGGRGTLGVSWTPERRDRTLKALNAPEALAKMSEASRLAKSSPEVRAKIADEATARWADPEMRAKQSVSIAAGKRASYQNDPTLGARIGAAGSATKARQRAERTHFVCKVHGAIPLADCYSKTSSQTGFTVYSCPACTLAAQKAKRDAVKAAKPAPAPRTGIRCRRHGPVPFAECFRIVRADGSAVHRCKLCNLAQQAKDRERRKTTRNA